MSKQSLVAFGDRVMADKTLHNRVRTLQPGDADGLIAIAAEVGYSFTVDELMEVIEGVKRQMQSGELTEVDLAEVAGGAAVDYFTKPMTFLAAYFQATPPSSFHL